MTGRVYYWNLPQPAATWMYVVAAAVGVILLRALFMRLGHWWRGASIQRPTVAGIARIWRQVLLQEAVRREPLAGWSHGLLSGGMLLLFIGTAMVAVDDHFVRYLEGATYALFKLTMELAGLALVTGVGLAFWRRFARRPAHLPNRQGDVIILLLLLLIALGGFGLESLRLAVSKHPAAAWSPVGAGLGAILASSGADSATLEGIHRMLWWTHFLMAMAAVIALGVSKLMHVVAIPVHLLTHRQRSALVPPIPFDIVRQTEAEVLAHGDFRSGFRTAAEIPGGLQLALDACTSCGRCEAGCPAVLTGTPLSPRRLVADLRQAGLSSPGTSLMGNLISVQALESCTTCGYCVANCPVEIPHLQFIHGLRASRVEEGDLHPDVQKALQSTLDYRNPWGMAWNSRGDWLEGLPVVRGRGEYGEILYWIGCASSFDVRGLEVATAVIRLADRAGVRLRVLGEQEGCCGDHARRQGDEGLYQQMVRQNRELFREYGVTKILVSDPHCLHTFSREYPDFGVNLEVMHHSEFLAQLIAEGRLKIERQTERLVTFHDPCYLGRHSDKYEAPREVLHAIAPQFQEMGRHGAGSVCCGAGGGHMFTNIQHGDRRAADLRLSEAVTGESEVVATACPNCTVMLDEASRRLNIEGKVRIVDLAVLLEESTRA